MNSEIWAPTATRFCFFSPPKSMQYMRSRDCKHNQYCRRTRMRFVIRLGQARNCLFLSLSLIASHLSDPNARGPYGMCAPISAIVAVSTHHLSAPHRRLCLPSPTRFGEIRGARRRPCRCDEHASKVSNRRTACCPLEKGTADTMCVSPRQQCSNCNLREGKSPCHLSSGKRRFSPKWFVSSVVGVHDRFSFSLTTVYGKRYKLRYTGKE